MHALRISLGVMFTAMCCGPVCAAEPANVLIIGDTVYSQFAKEAVAELKGQANVRFAGWPKLVAQNSTNALTHIDQLLGIKHANGQDVPAAKQTSWDLIHFNVGLSDLIHCVPNLKSHRVLSYDAGGAPRTDAKQYSKNLDALVRILKEKAPNAKLVWASTTPVRHSSQNVFKPGLEVEYNQIAERVMKKHRVPINDMYSHIKPLLNMDKPVGHLDPYFFDKKPFHPTVVDRIVQELRLKPVNRAAKTAGK